MFLPDPFGWLARFLRRRPAVSPIRKRRPRPLQLDLLETKITPAGTLSPLNNLPPIPSSEPPGIDAMQLMNDGTVIAQRGGFATSTGHSLQAAKDWYRLRPGLTGDYVDGTFSSARNMVVGRSAFPSEVLPDGKLYVFGGEYSGDPAAKNETNTAEVYDPFTNSWKGIRPGPEPQIGDVPTAVLPDGDILVGSLTGPETFLYHPSTNTWTQTGTKLRHDQSSEETWVSLPGGGVLSYDIWSSVPGGSASNTFHAQFYSQSTGQWADASATATDPTYGPPQILSTPTDSNDELGPGLLLPNGLVWQIGGNQRTAFYNPGMNTWTGGPDLPKLGTVSNPIQMGAEDASAAEMPNGHVLMALSQLAFSTVSEPTHFFDFDPSNNFSWTELTPPGTSQGNAFRAVLANTGALFTRMLVVPNGHVLISMESGTNQIWDYDPDGSPLVAAVPAVTAVSSNGGGTYTLTGTKFTGISEGACYGDEAEMSTNRPVVKLVSQTDGTVWYASTFNWTPGVATDGVPVTAQFTAPPDLPAGTYDITVSADGVSSVPDANNPITVTTDGPLYVDTTFTSETGNIADADPVLPGDQPGTLWSTSNQTGNCFTSLLDAINSAPTGGTVIVNGGSPNGDYQNTGVALDKRITLYLQGGGVSISSLSGVSAAAQIILADATLSTTSSSTTYDGSITGSGSMFVLGGGQLELDGPVNTGDALVVFGGQVQVRGTITSPGGVVIDVGTLAPEVPDALAGTTVTVNVDGGLYDPGLGVPVLLGGLAGWGNISLGTTASPTTYMIGGDGADTQYGGVFMGGGSVVKTGWGKLSVSAANEPAMGATVNDGYMTVIGTLDVNGASVVNVAASGNFDGVGVSTSNGTPAVNDTVSVSGRFSAGTPTAPGQLGVLSLIMDPANAAPGTFSARLFGTSPGTGDGLGYDKVTAFDLVNIQGATLNIASNTTYSTGGGAPTFTLIHNASGSNISGTFAGLPNSSSNPSVVCDGKNYFQIGGYNTPDITLTPIAPSSIVAGLQVNGGDLQRSEVTSVSVVFSRAVTFTGDPAAVFELDRRRANYTDTAVANLQATVTANSAGNTVVTLTFTARGNLPAVIDPISAMNGGAASLADGRYVVKTGQDGNGQYVSQDDTAGSGTGYHYGLYRFFGDTDGNGAVDSVDLGQFRSAFNSNSSQSTYLWYLDADHSGTVDSQDESQFRARFNDNVFNY